MGKTSARRSVANHLPELLSTRGTLAIGLLLEDAGVLVDFALTAQLHQAIAGVGVVALAVVDRDLAVVGVLALADQAPVGVVAERVGGGAVVRVGGDAGDAGFLIRVPTGERAGVTLV